MKMNTVYSVRCGRYTLYDAEQKEIVWKREYTVAINVKKKLHGLIIYLINLMIGKKLRLNGAV